MPPPEGRAPESRPTLTAVSADDYSLRVTIDAGLKAELDALKALLSHKIPSGDLRDVLREAVHCAIEKHGKRKGAVEPTRTAAMRERARDADRSNIAHASAGSRRVAREPTAEVRREVRKRDEGRCAWFAPDGRRCGSTWQLEIDHITAAALGGAATLDNCRSLCRPHNFAHAESTFGREHMDRFRCAAPDG